MKDKVEELDKTGGVYYNYCKTHQEPKKDYVGETERVLRERQYEHRVIDHETASRAASIDHPKKKERRITEQIGRRRSQRNVRRLDYKTMNDGSNQQLTEGSTEFSAQKEYTRKMNYSTGYCTLKRIGRREEC